MTQIEIILDHLKTHVGLTQLEATEKYKILRLSGRIHELRRRGYNILSLWRVGVNEYGHATRYVEYRLVDK